MIEIRNDSSPFGVCEVRGLEPTGGVEHAAMLEDVLARQAVVCLRMERALEDEELQSIVSLFGSIKDPVASNRNVDLT